MICISWAERQVRGRRWMGLVVMQLRSVYPQGVCRNSRQCCMADWCKSNLALVHVPNLCIFIYGLFIVCGNDRGSYVVETSYQRKLVCIVLEIFCILASKGCYVFDSSAISKISTFSTTLKDRTRKMITMNQNESAKVSVSYPVNQVFTFIEINGKHNITVDSHFRN